MEKQNQKQDLTQYSDNELSMWVFNDEYLYKMRKRSELEDILQEYFIFTPEQFEVLTQDLQDEALEDERQSK